MFSITFTLPTGQAYRVRAEVQQANCASEMEGGSGVAGGTIHDTSISIDDPRVRPSAYLSMQKGNGSYYFQR